MYVRGLYIHMYMSKVVLPPHELLDNVIPSLPISLLSSPPPCDPPQLHLRVFPSGSSAESAKVIVARSFEEVSGFAAHNTPFPLFCTHLPTPPFKHSSWSRACSNYTLHCLSNTSSPPMENRWGTRDGWAERGLGRVCQVIGSQVSSGLHFSAAYLTFIR